MSVSLAEPRARDFAVLEAVNHRHCGLMGRFRAGGVRSSRFGRPCFFLLAGRFVASVEFTSFVTMEIKYNVRGRVWLGVNR